MSGVTFRFIDTAGLRETHELIEHIGIERTILATDNRWVGSVAVNNRVCIGLYLVCATYTRTSNYASECREQRECYE